MAKIIIESVEDGYLISGDILKDIDRRARLHLKRHFDAREVEGGFLITSTEKENVISKLSEYFLKKDIVLDLDEEADEELTQMFQAEQNFQEFSLKAKKIWDNEVDEEEFKGFCNLLNNSLIRKLYPLQLLSAYHLAFSQNACNFCTWCRENKYSIRCF